MNRYWISLVIFALLVIVFGVALKRAPEKQQVVKSALIGKPAPEFVLPDLLRPDGKVSSADFRGQWYLVNVWGPWCASCSVEHPVLMDIRRDGKVAVLGVYYPEKNDEKDDQVEDDQARQWLVERGNPYEQVATDREGRVLIDFGVYGAPENFLVNPQGIIVKKWFVLSSESWTAARQEFIDGAKP